MTRFQSQFLSSLLLLICMTGCQRDQLVEVPYDEYRVKLLSGEFPELRDLTIRDEHGKVIDVDSFSALQRAHDYFDSFYQNAEGEVVEYRLVRAPDFRDLAIDCNDVERLLDSIYVIDQSIREEFDPRQDYANLEQVVNIIEKCGMPTSRQAMNAAFLVVQHNHSIHQKKYIDAFRSASGAGLIPRSDIALMEDRILMNDGKPQLYGSQLRRGNSDKAWQLYELFEPDKVDQRRAEVGLGPINDYLQLFGVAFDVEQVSDE